MPMLFGTQIHEPPRATMTMSVQRDQIPLAYVCHECGGDKKLIQTCPMCLGAGEVPTTQGLIVLAFAKKFLPWMQAREEKAMLHKKE